MENQESIYEEKQGNLLTGILGAFRVFDADGKPIPCDWSFTAAQADDSCMIRTRFDEPIEPECICRLTFNGETVFAR